MFVNSDVSYTHINGDIDLKILRVKHRYQLTVTVHFSATILSWHLYTAISRKVVGKNVHATIPKGNMGYDQYTVPDTVAVEPTFVAFL